MRKKQALMVYNLLMLALLFPASIWASTISGTITIEPITTSGIIDSDAEVTFQVREPGTLNVLYSRTLTLAFVDKVAGYTLTDVPAGTWDVAAKRCNTLADQVDSVDASGDVTGIDLTLYAGDAAPAPFGDNAINSPDYNALRDQYNKPPPDGTGTGADFNNDGIVGIYDYNILGGNWLTLPPGQWSYGTLIVIQ